MADIVEEFAAVDKDTVAKAYESFRPRLEWDGRRRWRRLHWEVVQYVMCWCWINFQAPAYITPVLLQILFSSSQGLDSSTTPCTKYNVIRLNFSVATYTANSIVLTIDACKRTMLDDVSWNIAKREIDTFAHPEPLSGKRPIILNYYSRKNRLCVWGSTTPRQLEVCRPYSPLPSLMNGIWTWSDKRGILIVCRSDVLCNIHFSMADMRRPFTGHWVG